MKNIDNKPNNEELEEKETKKKNLMIIGFLFIFGFVIYFMFFDDKSNINNVTKSSNYISNKSEFEERVNEPKINYSEHGNRPEGFNIFQRIKDLDGVWNYNSDNLIIKSSSKIVQFNSSGSEMKLDFIINKGETFGDGSVLPPQSYIYGQIGNIKIFRTRVYINKTKDSIYLDRVDGNTSHFYKKVK